MGSKIVIEWGQSILALLGSDKYNFPSQTDYAATMPSRDLNTV